MADLKESSLFKSLGDQQKHWYYHHKVRVIRHLLARNLLNLSSCKSQGEVSDSSMLRCMDIGAGNGIISRTLGSSLSGKQVTWDLVDSAYSGQEIGQDETDPSIVLYDSIPGGIVYDVIIAIDVIEHIEGDKAFVNLLAQHLAPNGLIIICVPAFQFLWGSHDIFLEHYRRYRIKDVTSLMSNFHLKVLDYSYLYVLLFPLIAIMRLLGRLGLLGIARDQAASSSDLKVYPKAVNTILSSLMRFERLLLQNIPFLGLHFGSSCIAIGRKCKLASQVKAQ